MSQFPQFPTNSWPAPLVASSQVQQYNSWPAPSQPATPVLKSHHCFLQIRQDPEQALVTIKGKEKARKPVDHPPIIELSVSAQHDPQQQFLQNPYLFMTASLLKADRDEPCDVPVEDALTGNLVSSLHRLKDTTNKDGGYFIFGDVSLRIIGKFRLRFTLCEIQNTGDGPQVQWLASIDSKPFDVQAQKDFSGMQESSFLSRAFSDQGVRIRLRKESRGMNAKRARSDEHNDASSTPLQKKTKVEPHPRVDSLPYGQQPMPYMPDLPSISNSAAYTNSFTNLGMPQASYGDITSNMPSNMTSNMPSNMPSNVSTFQVANHGRLDYAPTRGHNYATFPPLNNSTFTPQDGPSDPWPQ